MVRLHTFGGCFLARDGVRLDAWTGQRKALALLAVLAAAGARGLSRDVLVACFWPERDEERARASLKELAHRLRTGLGAPDLLLGTAELSLNPAAITSDVADFRDGISRGDDAAAAVLYAGPFLDGFHIRGSDGLERRVAGEREALARDAARVLERLADAAGVRGDTQGAVDWWHRLAATDPLSSAAALGLMRALDAAGERTTALRHARIYEALVREELDAGPDPAVVTLADELRRAPHSSPAPRPAHASPAPVEPGEMPRLATPAVAAEQPANPRSGGRRIRAPALLLAIATLTALGAWAAWGRLGVPDADIERSAGAPAVVRSRLAVAVLPFANTSGNPADEPLSDGFTDELIGALGRVPGVTVAGRTSVFALKGKGLTLRAVGDTLGVETVVEGSVRRASDRVRVVAQLVRVPEGTVLWADVYDRTLTDAITLQEELARSIAATLRVRLAGASRGVPVGRATTDPTAYELYLRGRHIFYTRPDREGTRQAGAYFAEAVARDPAYARAHAGLSDVHTRQAAFGFALPLAGYARAKAAAGRAIALDSMLAEAHVSLAHARCIVDFDWAGAERAFRRAIALDPGYTFARLPFAICLMGQGRFAEAVAQLDSARAADPLAPAPSNVLGRVYVNARRPDRAVRHLREALELNPQMDLAFQQLGHAYLQQGNHAAAIAAFERAAILSGARDSAHLAYAYVVTGRRAEGERILRSLTVAAPGRHVSPFAVAMAYAALGDADAAFGWLERGYAERAIFGVNVTPAFDGLHRDPRWQRLLHSMRLAPGARSRPER